MILPPVWGTGYGREAQYLHAYVHRLRQKLGRPLGHPDPHHAGRRLQPLRGPGGGVMGSSAPRSVVPDRGPARGLEAYRLWHGESYGSIWGRRPAWARPTPCSTRDGGGRSVAPTWSSAGCRNTADPRPMPRSATSRSSRAAPSSTGVRPSRRWTSTGSWPAARSGPGGRTGPHQRSRIEAPQALAGRRGTAGCRHQCHLHHQPAASRVAQRRSRTHHRRHPARDGARPLRAGGRPGGTGRHGPRGAAQEAGPRQHLSPRNGSTPPSATTSAPATSPPSGNWPYCGWPTGSTRSSTTIASVTALPDPGRPRSGWWSRSPVHAAAPSSSVAPLGWLCGPRPSWSACTCAPTTT